MNAIIVHSGQMYEAFPLMSLLIGIKKKYHAIKILWVGKKEYFDLVKFNKRIVEVLDIDKCYDLISLTDFYGSDICINPSQNKNARKFTSLTNAKKTFGFNEKGAVSRDAEFFHKIMSNEVTTNKTILDLYYNLAGLQWKGEGYGLSYYPKTKQSKKTGVYLNNKDESIKGERIKMPKELFSQLDVLNQFDNIITDDLFVTHASLALRKQVTCLQETPYKFNFLKE